MDGPPAAALERYNERTRFFPALSAAIWKADQSYKRRSISELELKAIAAYATMSRFFISASCSSCTKQLDWLQAQVKTDGWQVREALQLECEDGYPRYPHFEVNQNSLHDARAIATGKCKSSNLSILYAINAGAFLVPLVLLQDLQGHRSEIDCVRAWLAAPALQVIWVSKVFDDWRAEKPRTFYELAKMWGMLIGRRETGKFADGCQEQYDSLITAGHTLDI